VESELGPKTRTTLELESLRNIMKLYYDIGKIQIPRPRLRRSWSRSPRPSR